MNVVTDRTEHTQAGEGAEGGDIDRGRRRGARSEQLAATATMDWLLLDQLGGKALWELLHVV